MASTPIVAGRTFLIASTLLALTVACDNGPTAVPPKHAPLARAHSHNDYTRRRPLQDALDLGFCSIETDVWLVDDELLVGHDADDLRPERTIDSLYLAPLAERAAKNDGWIYDPGRTTTLLVDFKTGGATYDALKQRLEKYPQLFDKRPVTGGDAVAPIQVIISGDRPLKQFAAEEDPLCALDGRIADYDSDTSAQRMPLVSDAWPTQFAWSGQGEFPPAQREKLRRLADDVHRHGRKLRFWATPDNEAVWAELLREGVDVIGADDIEKLAKFLAAHEPEEPGAQ